MQLLRLRPAFEGTQIEWLSTQPDYAGDVPEKLHVVPDANQWQKWRMLLMFSLVAWVMLKVRPDVVVTTGAAPGFAAVLWGRLLGARTVWVDSIANSEELSGAGAKVGRLAHVWLTQWEHLARPGGPEYWGAVV